MKIAHRYLFHVTFLTFCLGSSFVNGMGETPRTVYSLEDAGNDTHFIFQRQHYYKSHSGTIRPVYSQKELEQRNLQSYQTDLRNINSLTEQFNLLKEKVARNKATRLDRRHMAELRKSIENLYRLINLPKNELNTILTKLDSTPNVSDSDGSDVEQDEGDHWVFVPGQGASATEPTEQEFQRKAAIETIAQQREKLRTRRAEREEKLRTRRAERAEQLRPTDSEMYAHL